MFNNKDMEYSKCCELKNGDKNAIYAEKKLPLTVQKCIENIIKEEDFKNYRIDVKDITTSGGNYLGILHTVDLIAEGGTGPKEINLFVKNATETDNFDIFSMENVYLRESFVYNDVFKYYDTLQDEFKIPQADRFKTVKCYTNLNSEAIVLENLTKKGFETGNRRDVISLEFAEMSIAQLAKFHALSFILRNKQPQYFEKHIKSKKNIINFEADWQGFLKKLFDVSISGLDGQIKKKLENYFPVYLEKYETYYKISGDHEDAICLCHGDYRLNNILKREINGELQEVIIVDYQLASYTCPVFDFLYFIFSSTDQKFRNIHMEYLKGFYYDTFERFFKHYGLRSRDVYTRERFEEDFRKKMDFGLVLFVTLAPFLFTTDDSVLDFNSLTDSDINGITLCEGYKERLRETVDFFIREGFL